MDYVTTIPTVDDLLTETAIGNGLHEWRVEGGVITIRGDVLRQALADAYDSTMPDWPALVELPDA